MHQPQEHLTQLGSSLIGQQLTNSAPWSAASNLGLSNSFVEHFLTHILPVKQFLGVISLDQLPDVKSLPGCYSLIINLSPSNKPGSHFVGIYRGGKHHLPRYFDSFGIISSANIPTEVQNFLKSQHPTRLKRETAATAAAATARSSKKSRSKIQHTFWITNASHLQPIDSLTCGLYCIGFVASMSRGYSFQDFLNLFPHSVEYSATASRGNFTSLKKNDKKIVQFIKTLMSQKKP